MKKRKARSKLKFIFKKCTPKSSRLYDLVTHYKLWYIRYLQKCNAFITSLVNFKRLATKKSKKRKQTSSCCSGKIKKSTCPAKTYCVSRMNLLRSGDVELNPGPEQNVNNQTNLSVDSSTLLNFRLGQLGLIALDVGGAGDCFFKAVSHQLYGNPSHHFHIRQAAVQYLRDNPERFIESNTQNSWNGYLTNMSMQGFFTAANDLKMEWLIVKGIKDFVNDSQSCNEKWKEFASVMAASVVANLLRDPVIFEDWPHFSAATSSSSVALTASDSKSTIS